MTHDLKILPEWFNAVVSGEKNFEIRKDDRNYKTGDTLFLREWDGKSYTGRTCKAKVTSIYRGEYCCDGYCIMSIEINKTRWIPCSDRLPEIEKDVLVYYPRWEDNPIQVAYIMTDGLCWEFSDGEFFPSMREVTHWMPLPEPPDVET